VKKKVLQVAVPEETSKKETERSEDGQRKRGRVSSKEKRRKPFRHASQAETWSRKHWQKAKGRGPISQKKKKAPLKSSELSTGGVRREKAHHG